MAGSFPIQNPTLAGGTALTQQMLDLWNQLTGNVNFRAGLGSDLFSGLMNQQLQAARSPINILDRLTLAGEIGSNVPLSQGSQEQLGRFTSRPQSNVMQDLLRRLNMFTVGALTPEQQVSEGFDPQTGLTLAPKQRDFLRAAATNAGRTPGTFADEPLRLAHGGRLTIDPNQAVSRGTSVAGPASVVDRTGRTVALAGEAGQRESLTVNPGVGGVGADRSGLKRTIRRGGTDNAIPDQQVPDEQLRRDEQFRFDEISRVQPNLSFDQRLNIARFPGGFEQFVGIQTDPRAELARRTGFSIAGDRRIGDPLVRSLALGRAPTGADLTSEEFFNTISPDAQNAIISLVGTNPEDLQQFLFSLAEFSPQGRRTRISGPVAA